MKKIKLWIHSNNLPPVLLMPCPLPQSGEKQLGHDETTRELYRMFGVVKDIPLYMVQATQEFLRKDLFDRYYMDNIPVNSGDPVRDLPLARQIGDRFVLDDGHHRASAARLRGDLMLKAVVI